MATREGRVAVLFDWDGTLCDSDFLFDLAVMTSLERHGLTKSATHLESEAFLPRTIPLRQSLRLPTANRTVILESIVNVSQQLEAAAQLFPGIRAMLVSLKSKGVPMAVVTGRSRSSFFSTARRLGVLDIFAHVVCAEDAPAKPAPDGIHAAVRALGAEDSLYVGNMVDDSQAALAAGCAFHGVAFCTRLRWPVFDPGAITVFATVADLARGIDRFLEKPVAL